MRISFVARRLSPANTPGSREPSPAVKVIMIAVLGFSALNMMRLAYTHDPRLKVPPALGYVTGVMLLFAAAIVGLRLLGREAKDWVVLPILLGMTAISAWIAIAGNESCRTRGPLILPTISCRAGFGIGAILLALMVLMLVYGLWRRLHVAGETRSSDDDGNASMNAS